MHESSVPGAAVVAARPERSAVRPAREPLAAGASPETALLLAEDHDRIAERLSDVVVRRIFLAALDLDAALGLVSEHRAAAKIEHAISELDLAVREIRAAVFDGQRPDSPADGKPGCAKSFLG
jgi:hypothetical protein